jgi:transcriptional regulator with XRE-family HTH domain
MQIPEQVADNLAIQIARSVFIVVVGIRPFVICVLNVHVCSPGAPSITVRKKKLDSITKLSYNATGCIDQNAMKKKTVHNISDIAKLAGVSKSTVSRALNKSPLIGQETRERIQAIAKQYDFKINMPAQRLSLKQSNTIAFVTHAYHKDFSVADLFGLEIMGGVSQGLYANGYDMLVVHVNPHETEWAHQYLDTGRADGFILMTSTRKRLL